MSEDLFGRVATRGGVPRSDREPAGADDVALLVEVAQDCEDSAQALDTPEVARWRERRLRHAARLRALAAALEAPGEAYYETMTTEIIEALCAALGLDEQDADEARCEPIVEFTRHIRRILTPTRAEEAP